MSPQIFTVGQDGRIWNAHFAASFPGAPAGLAVALARAKAHSDLRTIRTLRNRIAHHEPIFTRNPAADYAMVRELIEWRSPVAAAWVDQKQAVLELIPNKP